ncbi:MAG: histidine triad nucleotide-binding protein [Okeania sp. SIO3C4]|nr:histidine triad nucleotide-binding protein [Okeania sp. SIO3C4]
MSDPNVTLFTKIIQREIPANIVYEDELAIAFRDISPQAPVHILIVPKKPIPKLAEAIPEDHRVLGHLMMTVKRVADQFELQDYRVVINNGEGAGQSVFHLHLHLLGGRSMSWPPG